MRVKELQERVQLAPALLAAFPLYATDNNAVHVIVETLSHCSEAERGKLFAALRGVVEKSLEQPDVALEEGVKEVEAPAQEEEEEEEEVDEEKNEEEVEEEMEEEEVDEEKDEDEKEMEKEDAAMEEEKVMEEEKEEEEKKVTYKDVWSITAWSVLIKRLIKHCEEHEELKACLMTEIVTPLKGKWVWAKGVSIRFMKLIETYPASLFLVAVGVKSDA